MNADHTPRPTGGWPQDENRPVFAPATDTAVAANSHEKEQS
ncbi:hypothetical protein [Microbacterium sp. SD291]|nr:hypothetical protein [Microbacterium sp. SD291]